MAAASIPTLRSSRRVAGLHAPVERSTREKLQRIRNNNPATRDPSHQALHAKAEAVFEMPPKKKLRVEAPNGKVARPGSSSGTPATGRRAQEIQGHSEVGRRSRNEGWKLQTPDPPAKQQKPEEKRQLRSHGGASRIKSELALFFPCYDEVISNEPKSPGKNYAI